MGMSTTTNTELGAAALLRLLRLASPALPVGAYAYSQGLESAVDAGTVHDLGTARIWISDALHFSFARLEAPLWWRLHHAWVNNDAAAAVHWNVFFLAARETAELRAETLQMGYSLRRLLTELDELDEFMRRALDTLAEPTYPAVAAFAAASWNIPAPPGLLAYSWAWAENQVMAAMKAVPLGQLAGQRLLSALEAPLTEAAELATTLADDEIANFTPGLAIASSLHETQYSRIFRS